MYTRLLKKLSHTRLDDVLIDEGVLERHHVEDAQAESEMTGRPLSHVLFERGEMDEWELAKIVARNYSLPFIDVAQYSTPSAAEMLLDIEFCRTHMLLPFDVFGAMPAIAVCEMPSPAVLAEIDERCGELPFVYVTLRSRLVEVLAAREEAGNVPLTAADMPAPAPRDAAPLGAATDDGGAPSSAPLPALDLEPVCMRLGFNMHMRSAGSGGSLPPAFQRMPAVARAAPTPATREVPSVATAAVPRGPARAARLPEDAAASAPEAAWQSIFDLGDEAVDS